MLLFTVVILCLANHIAGHTAGKAPVLNLNDGWIMPTFGLGTWLGLDQKGGFVQVEDNSVEKAVEEAIDAGYRHIDTAALYDTEPQVGRAIQKKIDEGVILRGDIFVTTKLWNDQHAKEKVPEALKASLKKLNMDFVDLYLIHFPVGTYANNTPDNTDYLDTWRALIDARAQGLTHSIGVSNFNVKQIERLINETGVVPSVLQIELHLNLQQPELLAYCKQHGITVMGYTPFGALFPSKARPGAPPPRVDDPALVDIAKKHNKTVPQVVLRYLFELGAVPIPKSVNPKRIEENINIFDFRLTKHEKEVLKTFDSNYRLTVIPQWANDPNYPF
ncbi:aldo-keto reductase AKR2E4-like [Colias croceus]|uniref:aldo-keto reductase AKR2E4-like n=1 Tax=Colias crocea TaxID=72248 RepID=UPI001E280A47|nr:aldo-keto reductase AKR2E4-like [Colias croceus]